MRWREFRCIGPVLAAALAAAGCGPSECPEPAAGARATQGGEQHAHGQGYLHGKKHRFDDPEKWAEVWENEGRDGWQRPVRVMKLLEIGPDSVVADVGAGTGYFSVRIAEQVPAGHVWAVDIEPNMVRHINERAREGGHDNLFAVLGLPGDPLIPEPVDVLLMVNTYHHLPRPTAYFETVKGYLGVLGRVAIVDFKQGKRPVGPPEEMKIAPEKVQEQLRAAGYVIVADDRETLPHQYIVIAELQRSE